MGDGDCRFAFSMETARDLLVTIQAIRGELRKEDEELHRRCRDAVTAWLLLRFLLTESDPRAACRELADSAGDSKAANDRFSILMLSLDRNCEAVETANTWKSAPRHRRRRRNRARSTQPPRRSGNHTTAEGGEAAADPDDSNDRGLKRSNSEPDLRKSKRREEGDGHDTE